MPEKLSKLLATFFYIGYVPKFPGTCASAVGILIYMVFCKSLVSYGLILVAVTIIGFVVSDQAEKILGQKDPSCVVIDEIAGVLLACFLLPATWPVMIGAFVLFRIFDIFKIYPVNKFEAMPGGVGIMADDLVAGLYTNLIMHVAIRCVGIV